MKYVEKYWFVAVIVLAIVAYFLGKETSKSLSNDKI